MVSSLSRRRRPTAGPRGFGFVKAKAVVTIYHPSRLHFTVGAAVFTDNHSPTQRVVGVLPHRLSVDEPSQVSSRRPQGRLDRSASTYIARKIVYKL